MSLSKKTNIFAVLIGNALEYYCLTLYGFLAIYLAPIFFPNQDPYISKTLSFMAFAFGFFMRPLGALFFGHLGDKWGRKKSLMLSILLVTIPTMIIGLVPSYESIGIWAPIIIMVSRLLQGFCSGGESTGSAIFLNEHLNSKKEGYWGSILCASSLCGALIATFIAALFTHKSFPDWGWRIPFLLSCLFGIIGFRLRRNLTETPIFLAMKSLKRVEKLPLIIAIKENFGILIAGAGISAASLIPFYISSAYLNKVVIESAHITLSHSLFLDVFIMFSWVVFLPIFGWISDKFSKIDVMILAAFATIIASIPFFYLLSGHLSLYSYFSAQILLALVGSAFVAPINAIMPKLFSERARCTGFALSFALGASIFGGTTPLILTFLDQYTLSPSTLYLAFSGFIGLISLIYIRFKSHYPSDIISCKKININDQDYQRRNNLYN